MTQKINIVLVEDHPKYRQVIEMALSELPDIDLNKMYGTAETALRAIENISESPKPDVILLDLNLPGMSGIEAIPFFKSASPKTKIIILTQSDNETNVLKAIQQGAAGYLLKSSTVLQITEGIQTVANGGAVLDGDVALLILNELRIQPPKINIAKSLTDRELEILTLLSEGLVKKEIGDRLNIGYGSVATYIRRIYEKLNVINAPAAVAKAFRSGILSPKD